jgi:hypothetical protein
VPDELPDTIAAGKALLPKIAGHNQQTKRALNLGLHRRLVIGPDLAEQAARGRQGTVPIHVPHSYDPLGCADYDLPRGDIFCNHRTHSDDGTIAYRHPGPDDDAHSNPDILPDDDRSAVISDVKRKRLPLVVMTGGIDQNLTRNLGVLTD